jgi:preprotein translocase SecE subunit
MEPGLKKWANGVIAGSSILVGYVSLASMLQIASRFDLESRIPDVDLWMRVLSVVLGVISFIALRAAPASNNFINEVIFEASRVTWLKPSDTWKHTWVVFIFVAIAGLILGLLDVFWAWGIRAIF